MTDFAYLNSGGYAGVYATGSRNAVPIHTTRGNNKADYAHYMTRDIASSQYVTYLLDYGSVTAYGIMYNHAVFILQKLDMIIVFIPG